MDSTGGAAAEPPFHSLGLFNDLKSSSTFPRHFFFKKNLYIHILSQTVDMTNILNRDLMRLSTDKVLPEAASQY